ncbi:hypothetical protein [Janthinobacterium sp. PSPC2-1]|uniref:hypothetical protein n=1 Tax=unclassified Janthinobacterium TaxID=2610881 RepID=UPI003CF0CF18
MNLLYSIDMAAAAIVLARGLFAELNHMQPCTSNAIRITWIALTAGAAAVLLFGVTPAWPEVLLHCGIAALVCVNRRSSFWKGSSCN